jgi:hypothetical protein
MISQFVSDHPWMTFFIVLCTLGVVETIVIAITKMFRK